MLVDDLVVADDLDAHARQRKVGLIDDDAARVLRADERGPRQEQQEHRDERAGAMRPQHRHRRASADEVYTACGVR